jgi:hypothetical protein
MPGLVLVVGAPRSGTTWVQTLLAADPAVATPQETDLLSRYVRPLHDAWEWQLRGQPDDWARRRFKGLPGVLRSDEQRTLVRDLVARVLDTVVANAGGSATVVVEKSPSNSFAADLVAAYLPEAKVVHVIRDGRDVAASLNAAAAGWGRDWAPSSVPRAAKAWREHVEAAQRFPELGIPYHELRYEALASLEPRALAELLGFCGLDADADECDRRLSATTLDAMAAGGAAPMTIAGEFGKYAAAASEPEGFFGRGGSGRWRESWGASERLAFAAEAGDLLVELGYESDPGWAADAARSRRFRTLAAARHAVGAAARRVGRLADRIDRRP